MFLSVAYAQAQSTSQPNLLEGMLPILLIFLIFYFLIIRPQSKQRKQHQKLLTELKRGDEVLTSGGILGTIEGLTDKYVTLEIAEGVKIKILRGSIAGFTKEMVKETVK